MAGTEEADRTDGLVTLTIIAERCGVTVAAVSNWRARHATFPAPARKDDGTELFDAAAVAGWLATRAVPQRSRKPDETVGVTYAQRFLNLAQDRRGVVADRDELAAIWSSFDELRPAVAAEEYDELVLGMVWLRLRDPEAWSWTIQGAGGTDPREWSDRALQLPLPPLSVRLFDGRTLRAVGTTALRRLVRLLADLSFDAVVARAQVDALVLGLLDRTAGLLARYGEHYTPSSVRKLMTALTNPPPGARVHDPFCRAGELLVEAAVHQRPTHGNGGSPKIVGRVASDRLLRLSGLTTQLSGVQADLAVREILEGSVADRGTADIVLVNPPFNLRPPPDVIRPTDSRWRYGVPPPANANFAWLQHVLWLLAPDGRAAVVMPTMATSSSNPTEMRIREKMIQDGVVEAVVALPDRLFASTGIAVSLWILHRPAERSSETEVLLIDATGFGALPRRGPRALRPDDVTRIVEEYQRWRGRRTGGRFVGVAGLSASVPRSTITRRDADLSPRRHVQPDAHGPDLDAAVTEVRRLRRVRDETAVRLDRVRATLDLELQIMPVVRHGDAPRRPRASLRDVCALLSGPARIETEARSSVPVLVPRNIGRHGLTREVMSTISTDDAARMARYRLERGDVVGVRAGDLGRFGVVETDQEAWLLGPGCFRLRPLPDVDPYFLAHLLSSPAVREWLDRRAVGSAIRAISMKALGGLLLELPPLIEQRRTASVLSALDAEASAYEQAATVAGDLREVLRAASMAGIALDEH